MQRLFLLGMIVLLVLLGIGHAQAQLRPEYGSFLGPLDLRMSGNGRDASLLAAFVYIDPQGKKWEAPQGITVNGASIPQPLWSLIGSPWTGRYREASVVHDYFCDKRNESWRGVHKMFYRAMLANGVEALQAKLMYATVYRFGPRWDFECTPQCANCLAVPYHVDAYTPKFDLDQFEALKAKVQTSNPSLDQIESDADAAVRSEIRNLELGKPVLIR